MIDENYQWTREMVELITKWTGEDVSPEFRKEIDKLIDEIIDRYY